MFAGHPQRGIVRHHPQQDPLLQVLLAEDTRPLLKQGDHVPPCIGNDKFRRPLPLLQNLLDPGQKFADPAVSEGADADRVPLPGEKGVSSLSVLL